MAVTASRETGAVDRCPAWVRATLRCPRCKAGLEWENGQASCGNLGCDLGVFPVTECGQPVLIDFENSVVSEEGVVCSKPPGDSRIRFAGSLLRSFRTLSTNVSGASNYRTLGALLEGIAEPRVLLIGGGDSGRDVRSRLQVNPSAEIVNTDVYAGPFVHLLADAHQLPVAAETFDLVIANAVLEHLLDPAVAVAEIWRVLKASGLVYADTPFLQAVHMGAFDFMRFSPLGHRALFRDFEEIDRGVTVGPMSVMRWSVEHAAKCLFRSRRAGWFFRPLTLPLGWLERYASRTPFALDACSGSYFIGRKSSRTLSPKEIVAAYRGGQ